MSQGNQKYNLTDGPIMTKLLLVALPIMGTQFMQMTYNLTDMFWLGRLNSDVVAASGSAGMYIWLSQGPLMVGRMGAEIGVSQQLGRGDQSRAKVFAQNAMVASLLLGIVVALFIVLPRHLLIGFFNIREAHVASDAASYLAVVGLAIPITYISATITGIFNGSGNSRVPFYINAVGLVVNMILDPLMILGLGWGIVGAALATAIGQIVVCVLFLIAVNWFGSRPFEEFRCFVRPSVDVVKQLFRWTTPISLESMLFTLLALPVTRMVAAFGAGAMAVQRVCSQVESLSWMIANGFSSAQTSFTGQNYGAGKWARIHQGFRISTVTIFVWGVMVTVLLFFWGGSLVRIFLPDPEIVKLGAEYLRILALCQISCCLEAVGGGTFRGIGRTLPPSVASVAGNVFRVPLAWWLTMLIGLPGIWWGVSIGAFVRGLWIFLWCVWMLHRQPKDDLPAAEVVAE